MKTSHPLSDCKDVFEEAAHPLGVSSTMVPDSHDTFVVQTNGAPHSFVFAAAERDVLKWIAELKWRIEAHKRANAK